MDYTTGDVICLYLNEVDAPPDGDRVPEALTATGIASALDLQPNVNDRVELLSELRTLQERDLIAEQVRPVEGHEGERRTYRLTEAGERHSAQVYDRLRNRTVVVSNGVTEEVPLEETDRFFDDNPLVQALTNLEDGTIDLGEYSGQEFFDRTEELSALTEAYEAAGNHVPRGVLVTGEAGVGKTALLGELQRRLADYEEPPVVARGASSADADAPYQAIERAIDDLDEVPSLERFLEGIEAVPGDDTEAAQYQRQAMFTDVADAIRAAARESPIVVAVEDLQWANESTIALLTYLLESVDEWIYQVLFVGTYRPDGVDATHPLVDLLEVAEETDRHSKLELDPLDAFNTRGILQRQFDTETVPDHFVEWIHAQTGGNPLFVEETAKQLLETDLVNPQRGVFPTDEDEITLPEQVTGTIADRLAGLDETGRRVLELGAVIGVEFRTEVLKLASDLDEPTLQEYVGLLVESHIWDRSDDGLQFVHGVVRTTVLDGLDERSTRRYHAAVANALETVYLESLEDRYARMGFHYERAGEPAEAVEYYRRAGDRARSVHAPETAIENYQQALGLARDHGFAPTEKVTLLDSLAETHTRIAEYDTAQDYIEEGLEVVDDLDDNRELLALAADIAHSQGDFDRALSYTADGLDLDGPDSPAVLRLLDRRARAHLLSTDFEKARETAHRQLDLAVELGDEWEIGAAKTLLGFIGDRASEYATAEEYLTEAVEIFERLDDRYKLGDALDHLASVSVHTGEFEQSRELRRRTIDIAETVGDRREMAQRTNNLALLEDRLRNWAVANEHFRDALEITREIDDVHGENTVLYNIGTSLFEWGKYEKARERLLEALELARENGYDRLVGTSLSGLGAVAIETGNLEEAADRLESARTTLEASAEDRMVARNVMRYGDLFAERGEYEAARENYEDALATFEEIGVVKLEMKTLRRLVRLERDRDNHARARELCSRGLELIDEQLPEEEFEGTIEWFETQADRLEDPPGDTADG